MSDRSHIVIYTDGGADPNPGTGGWGAVLVDPANGRRRELSGGAERTTNNRMELTAAIEALSALEQPSRVDLYTDSQYLRRGITEWLKGWEARGWQRRGGEVQNLDLWQQLAELNARHEVRWHWVRGHSGDPLNERADSLATAEIRRRAPRAAAVGSADATGSAVPAGASEVFLRVTCAGGRGAWAALVRHGGQEEVLSGQLADTTSNRLDLTAATAALERLPSGTVVAVHTASDYLRHGASRWLQGWRERGWKTREGGAVKNRELWQRLDEVAGGRSVAWPDPGNALPAEIEALEPALAAARVRSHGSGQPG